MQATRFDPPPQGNDTDEESDLQEFKEIPPEDITVAIFCALPYESVAVKYSLDEGFECRPRTIGPRKYVYSFGRIGDHKIVIARPHQTGTVKAAQCAATVSQQFPNVRFALMIGIGAGIPNFPKYDIRLGDIAVSIPQENHPGVLEYDFGKYEADGKFVLKGSLDKPPSLLISADGSLEEDEMMNRSRLRRILKDITKQPGYARPNKGDVLFDATFHHVNKGDDCSGCEASSEMKIVPRAERDKRPRQPVVHRGLILSGGGVVKNPGDRDRLCRGRDDAICFEMQAAGIMDELPCLVVRGICDYADTHKQDGWHHYAAAVAAAYGKAVLLKVYGQDVEETRSMRETMEKLLADIQGQAPATEHGGILDWLTEIDYGPRQSYHLKRRQPGTGQWLLNSPQFKTWIETEKQTLFCPGIPGAGKTILTSIVVEKLTAHFENDKNVGVAYVYCDFQRQGEQEVELLLASLLKQLAQGLSSLPASVRSLYDKHKGKWTRPSFDEISRALQSVANLYSRALIIVDALDECQVSDRCRERFLSELFNFQDKTGANLFATSRPMQKIENEFNAMSIRLKISARNEDVEKYLDSHVLSLPLLHERNQDVEKETKEKFKDEIKTNIVDAVNGVFLLARLHLDSLKHKTTLYDLSEALKGLPKGETALAEAYGETIKRIRSQSKDFRLLAERVLSLLTCAERLLTKWELQDALAVRAGTPTLDRDKRPCIGMIVDVCAGLVTFDEDSGILRLAHDTTRGYLAAHMFCIKPQEDPATLQDPMIFDTQKNADAMADAHNAASIICVTYLSFDDFESGFCPSEEEFQERLRLNPLYDYAARAWGHHARKSLTSCQEVADFLDCQAKVEASSQALMAWKALFSQAVPKQMTGLHLAAYFGVRGAVNTLLQRPHSVNVKDSDGRTPLSYAAQTGNEAVVEMLLAANGVYPDSSDSMGQTPLSYAAKKGHEAVVKLLLAANGICPDSKNFWGQTPLSFAAEGGYETIVQLLLQTGKVDPDSKATGSDDVDRTPLSLAAEGGHETIVQLLLQTGKVDPDSQENAGRTPLWYATRKWHRAVADLLLRTGAKPLFRPLTFSD
ncbi:hypothetical protein ACHAPT_009612 [Fusarium lateritium]